MGSGEKEAEQSAIMTANFGAYSSVHGRRQFAPPARGLRPQLPRLTGRSWKLVVVP